MGECGSGGPSEMECRQIAELLGDYFDGSLPSHLRDLLEWHIEGCQPCVAFINTYRRVPIAAGVAGLHYPTQGEIERALQEAGVTGVFVPELLPASMTEANEDQQHNSRINIIMLGVFAGYTHLLPCSLLEQAIAQRLPRFAEQNMRTFHAGWNYGEFMKSRQSADH